jgi:hypothetical protein
MPPEQMQPSQEEQEASQEEQLVKFLQELDARVTALEEKETND